MRWSGAILGRHIRHWGSKFCSRGRSPGAISPTRPTVIVFCKAAARMLFLNLELASHRGDQAKTDIVRYPSVSAGHVLPTFRISKLDKPPGGAPGESTFQDFRLGALFARFGRDFGHS